LLEPPTLPDLEEIVHFSQDKKDCRYSRRYTYEHFTGWTEGTGGVKVFKDPKALKYSFQGLHPERKGKT